MHDPVQDILMAEDSNDDTELTLGALAENNLASRVVRVVNGVEALDYLYRRGKFAGRTTPQPILFLLDVKMPKIDGLEVLRQIKKDPDLVHIPVVMLSSSSEVPDVREACELGASAYVVKPVRFDEFVEAVKTIGTFWAVLNVLRPMTISA